MKKEYTKPSMQVVEITKNSGILCSSVETLRVRSTSYGDEEGDWEDL